MLDAADRVGGLGELLRDETVDKDSFRDSGAVFLKTLRMTPQITRTLNARIGRIMHLIPTIDPRLKAPNS